MAKTFLDYCESPAERAFAEELLDWPDASSASGRGILLGHFGMASAGCVPQVSVDIPGSARYRLDFLFWVVDGDKHSAPLVVEIDGFDWHDRTREQAERDRLRDRRLLVHGFRVIRFTGGEALRVPDLCVLETEEALAYGSGMAAPHGTWRQVLEALGG